jgi:hypothetical protein
MTWPSVAIAGGLLLVVFLAFEGARASIDRAPGYMVLAAILALVVLHERALAAVIGFLLRLRGR